MLLEAISKKKWWHHLWSNQLTSHLLLYWKSGFAYFEAWITLIWWYLVSNISCTIKHEIVTSALAWIWNKITVSVSWTLKSQIYAICQQTISQKRKQNPSISKKTDPGCSNFSKEIISYMKLFLHNISFISMNTCLICLWTTFLKKVPQTPQW